jgi:predicted component of type VI protein secretion system
MTQKILYKQENKKIAMLSWAANLTATEAAKDLPDGTAYILVNDTSLPPSEDLIDFFDAIRVDFATAAITFEIEEARSITKERLRRERVIKFEENDIKLRDAMLDNNAEKTEEAIAERNRLRDITLLADSKNTLVELRNLHP